MAGKDYEQRTEELVQPVVDEHGFELVDVEYVKEAGEWYLRVYIDKPGGITIDDCEVVSRRLSDLLDEKDFIKEAYILEVSSPGLGRPLKKDKDFKRSIGQEVEIKTYKAIIPAGQGDGSTVPLESTGQIKPSPQSRKEFSGVLKAFDEETVTIDSDGGEMVFNRKDIALIRLAFDF